MKIYERNSDFEKNWFGFRLTKDNSQRLRNGFSAVILILIYLDIPNFAELISHGAILPKYFYYFSFLLCIPSVIKSPARFIEFAKRRFCIAIYLLLFLNFANILFEILPDAEIKKIVFGRILELILSIFLVYKIGECERRYVLKLFFAISIILLLIQICDFMSPGSIVPEGSEGSVFGRAAGTLVNANKAAESLLLAAAFGLRWVPRQYRFWYVLAMIVGPLTAFSRSGIIAWFFLYAIGLFRSDYHKRTIFITLVFMVLLTGGISAFVDNGIQGANDTSISDLENRIGFLASLDISDASGQERITLANHAIKTFLGSPIFGNGAGYTTQWSFSDRGPHNQHLLMLAEYGVVGYIVFVWLTAQTVLPQRRVGWSKSIPFRMDFFAIFLVFSLFTHNMFDNLYWLVSVGLISYMDDAKLND